MSSPTRPLSPGAAIGRIGRTAARGVGQVGLGLAESGLTTTSGLLNLVERFGPDVISDFIANELQPIADRGNRFVREALPPENIGEVGERLAGRLGGDVLQFAGTGGPVRAGARALGATRGLRGILGSAPVTAIQAAAGPEESTSGAVASLLEGVGRGGAISTGLREIAEDPGSRIATEVGLDLLTGALTESALEGIKRLRGPLTPRQVGGGGPLLARGRPTSPGVTRGARRPTDSLATGPGEEGDLFSLIGRSDRLGEGVGRGGIIPQESISERLIAATGGMTARQRVDLTRQVRQRVFPQIEEILGESALRSGFDMPGVARTSEGLGVFEGAVNPNTIYNLGDAPAALIERRAAAHGIVEGQNAAVWFRLIDDATENPVNPGAAYIIAGPNGTNLDPADFRELHEIILSDPVFAPLAEGSTFFEGRAIYRNFGETDEGEYAALVRTAADRMKREVDLELGRVEGNFLDGPTAYRAAFEGDQEALERLIHLHEFEVRPLFGEVGVALGDPDVVQRSRQWIDSIRSGAKAADRARATAFPELIFAAALAGGTAAARRRGDNEEVSVAAGLGAMAGLAPAQPQLSQRMAGVQGVASLQDTPREVSGIGYVSRYLKGDEAATFQRATAARMMDLFDSLPEGGEIESGALSGRTARGWHRQSSEAIVEVFGPDAPRFAAVVAALSPQESVQRNLAAALEIWSRWTGSGRPTDPARLGAMVPAEVAEALTSLDPVGPALRGADDFTRKLLQETTRVTLDTWMAKLTGWERSMFNGHVARKGPGKGPAHLDYAARVQTAADAMTRMTGVRWTPEEVQQTVWSWAYPLGEVSGRNRLAARTGKTTPNDLVGQVTDEVLSRVPDFRSLLDEPAFKEILIRGNGATPRHPGQPAGAGGGFAGEAEGPAGFAGQQPEVERPAPVPVGAVGG